MTAAWKPLLSMRQMLIGVAGSKDGAHVLVVLCLSGHFTFVAAATLRLFRQQFSSAAWTEVVCVAIMLAVVDVLLVPQAARRLRGKNA